MSSETVLYKYSGAGNDFIVIDGRGILPQERPAAEEIRSLCDRKTGFKAADGRIGADGFMVLDSSAQYDFRMEFYNPDGSSGMMCGNGGRCIVAFADFLGLEPAEGRTGYVFEAADGLHSGEILARDASVLSVRIGMIDAHGMRELPEGIFLETGTRHLVCFVDDVERVDVATEGARLRWDEVFAPIGTNVNFVEVCGDGSLRIRTFEKGVEAETLACGTGITAAAIAYHYKYSREEASQRISVLVHARIADLTVSFVPVRDGETVAKEVFLTGPAEQISSES